MRVFLLLLILLGIFASTDSKFVTGITRIDPLVPEQYLGRFSFSSKLDGSIKGNIRVNTENTRHQLDYFDTHRSQLGIYVFDDAQWKRYNHLIKKGSLCRERMQIATYKYPIGDRTVSTKKGEPLTFTHYVRQQKNVLDLYVVLSDCLLEEYNVNPPELNYSVSFLNGTSELPQDETYIPHTLIVVMIVLTISVIGFFYLLHGQNTRYHQYHLTQILLGAAFLTQLVAVVAQLLHLFVYSINGQGLKLRYTWFAFDFVSEITQLFSELIIAFVLICLSMGWTLSDSFRMTELLKPQYVTLMGFFSVLHIYLQYKGRAYEEDFNYFHDFTHWPGFSLMALRLLLLGVFLIGMALSYSYVPSFILKITAFRRFFQRIGAINRNDESQALDTTRDDGVYTLASYLFVIGSLWFLAFPFAAILSLLVQPSMRRLVVVSLSLFSHIAVLLTLMFAFLVDSSLYHQKSTLNNLGTVFAATRSTGKTAID